ncbi:small s protein [Venturia nashicola]|nr:small s protein [Venturia nashicola]
MSSKSGPADHRWEGIIAQDHARLHSGHVYNQVNNIHNYAPGQSDSEATRHQTEGEWTRALLNWLMFAEIDDRREQVREAHQETFKWILEDGHESGFAKWLAVDDGIYWIQGKPGSGKSTLMKFIMRNQRTQDLLRLWTGETPLTSASFWFWAAGSTMQRTLSGLYRSLLYQVLKIDKHLCRVAFPNWQQKFAKVEPTMAMMTSALHAILRTDTISTNFFFAIDGLDEYDQDSIGKMDLTQIFLGLARSKRVKFLVSSRPEAVFQSSLRHCPTVRLESMTALDILSFVKTRLWSNPSLRDISDSEKRGISDIEEFIIENAHGVFLWVALVLNIALDGINNFEDPLAIRDRVKLLPDEINHLFEHILFRRIPQHCRQEAFRYLLAALHWVLIEDELNGDEHPATYLFATIVIIAQQVSSYDVACKLASSALPESDAARLDFSSRLAVRCHSLLECVSRGHSHSVVVTFLHRTLFDYLSQDKAARRLLESGVGGTYDVNTALMAGIVSWANESNGIGIRYESWVRRQPSVDLMFFRLSALAEHATGDSQYKLIAAFNETRTLQQRSAYQPIAKDVNLGRPGSLGYAVYMGCTLYPKKALQNGDGVREFNDFEEFSQQGRHQSISREEVASKLLFFTMIPWFPRIDGFLLHKVNLDAAAMLMAFGADPLYEYGGWTPWRLVLRRIAYLSAMQNADGIGDILIPLQFLKLFAQHASSLPKCAVVGYGGKDTRSCNIATASDRGPGNR